MSSTLSSGRTGTSIAVGREHTHVATSGGSPHVFEAESGFFVIEGASDGARRRVVEFLAPGELISDRILDGFGAVRFRAVEAGILRRHMRTDWLQNASRGALAESLEAAAARVVIANAILAVSDIDARVASFLGAIALRLSGGSRSAPAEVPLSRDDVASHIQINPDTLSRCYSRLRAKDLITRSHHNRLVVRDSTAILALSPIAAVIGRTYEKAPSQPGAANMPRGTLSAAPRDGC